MPSTRGSLSYQALAAGRASIGGYPQVNPFVVFDYELVERDIGITDGPESIDQFQALGNQIKSAAVLMFTGGNTPNGLV
jgi:hypothetical protein